MKFDLQATKAKGHPRATCDLIGLRLKVQEDVADKEAADKDRLEILKSCDAYLENFTHLNGFCPGCNWNLGGIFGTFTFGVRTGEGNCNNCGYPCRSAHDMGGVKIDSFILPYHPIVLAQVEPEAEEA